MNKEELLERFSANEDVCNELVRVMDIFSNRTRFRILCILKEGDFCVSDITELTGECRISNISQQLKTLALAGIIKRYRVSKKVYYSLKEARISNILDFLHNEYMHRNFKIEEDR